MFARALVAILCGFLMAGPASAGTYNFKRNRGVAGGQGDVPSGSNTYYFWTTRNPDKNNGASAGSGSDSNPFPGDRSSYIYSGVFGTPFINATDWVHMISGYNGGAGGGTTRDTDNYAAGLTLEYSYDNSLRSGAEYVELNYSITPATHYITFSAGTGTIQLGDNITFSNGAVCRYAGPNASQAMGAVSIRMTCVDHTPPANTNTISSCSGTCTGPPTGTVSGTPVNETSTPIRPFTSHWLSGNNGATTIISARESSPGSGSIIQGLVITGAGSTYSALGWGGWGTANTLTTRVSLPANTSMGNNLPIVAGDIGFDTTGASTTGGQLVFHDDTAERVLQPTDTHCFQWANLDATDDNVNLPIAFYQPVKITAMACRDDTSAAPATAATLTLETLAGTAITLDSTLTCVGNATTMTFVTTSDADATLASGAGVRFDTTNTPNPATDSYTICVAYMSTHQ